MHSIKIDLEGLKAVSFNITWAYFLISSIITSSKNSVKIQNLILV